MSRQSAEDGVGYAVIFTSRLRTADPAYEDMAEKMLALATAQPGFVSFESARDDGGLGISISYWRDRDSLLAWRRNAEHLLAQKLGREQWYAHYRVRVARVERDYEWGCDASQLETDHARG